MSFSPSWLSLICNFLKEVARKWNKLKNERNIKVVKLWDVLTVINFCPNHSHLALELQVMSNEQVVSLLNFNSLRRVIRPHCCHAAGSWTWWKVGPCLNFTTILATVGHFTSGMLGYFVIRKYPNYSVLSIHQKHVIRSETIKKYFVRRKLWYFLF